MKTKHLLLALFASLALCACGGGGGESPLAKQGGGSGTPNNPSPTPGRSNPGGTNPGGTTPGGTDPGGTTPAATPTLVIGDLVIAMVSQTEFLKPVAFGYVAATGVWTGDLQDPNGNNIPNGSTIEVVKGEGSGEACKIVSQSTNLAAINIEKTPLRITTSGCVTGDRILITVKAPNAHSVTLTQTVP